MYNENGDKITENIDIAEAFKESQGSIFQQNTSNNITENYTVPLPYDHIFGIPSRVSKYKAENQISEQEVEKAIHKLKTTRVMVSTTSRTNS